MVVMDKSNDTYLKLKYKKYQAEQILNIELVLHYYIGFLIRPVVRAFLMGDVL